MLVVTEDIDKYYNVCTDIDKYYIVHIDTDKYCTVYIDIDKYYTVYTGARGSLVVKALRYKRAGRGFDSRWCHWNFSVT